MYIPLTFEGALQQCLYASGGIMTSYISGQDQYIYHLYTSSGQFEVFQGTVSDVDILVVGGGGGGAYGLAQSSGGGGGGGVDYRTNERLFKGIYNVVVGAGGKGGTLSSINSSNGNTGVSSSFVGSNINMIGQPGTGGQFGNTFFGGTSGNGFAGDQNSSTVGGGGGGASGSTTNQDGGPGILANLTGYDVYYGCGGGGGLTFNGTPGYSCMSSQYGQGSDTAARAGRGAPFTGMGGGGSLGNYGVAGGDGGSGSVLIRYKINDYCRNFFNQTGSCGCDRVTINITDNLNYYPDRTGSYVYTPCGTTAFVSGSLLAEYPTTICIASGSLVWYNWVGEDGGIITSQSTYVYDSFNNLPSCISASFGIETCTTQSVPTSSCSQEAIVTFFASASVQTAKYFPAHSSSFHFESIPANNVRYRCVQSGSITQIGNGAFYPIQMSGSAGDGIIYYTASCSTIQITSATGRGIITYCNSGSTTLINPSSGSTYCIDMSVGVRPVTGFSTFSYNILGSCLSGSFDTASCGC